jgi:hypothetical protein
LAIFASPIAIRSMFSFSRKGASDREDGELAKSREELAACYVLDNGP